MRRSVGVLACLVVLVGCGGTTAPGSADDELPVMRAVLDLATDDLVDWGCGHAFTIGTVDQRVRLTLRATGGPGEAPTPGVVQIDGENWSGELVTGSDLFAQWCDDVIEAGEPDVVEVSTHAVTGTLTWRTDGTGNCDGPATGRLTDGAVEVDGESLPLPDLEFSNEFFGCFAG